MKILYIGAGFVGACSAAVSASSGHTTLVYDINTDRVTKLGSGDRDTIESCLFERGLGDLLVQHRERVRFTIDYKEVGAFLDTADAIFMCLPTPEIGETGESDLTHYLAAAKELAGALSKRNGGSQEKYIVIVNKSTVPIDMAERAQQLFTELGVKNIGIVSNPEFLIEGKAVAGAMKPDRVVVGAWNEKDFSIMRQVYQRFVNAPGVQYIEVNPKEAEAGKLLANFYLFNKLAVCFDVIGRTSETFKDIQFEHLRQILMTDPRIGDWGFYNSLYAGGSCLIKDARSLSYQLQTAGQNAILVNETYLANERQLQLFLGRAKEEAKIQWAGKKVRVLGLSFKRDTNDIRNSPSLNIVRFLEEQGVGSICLYDPAGTKFFSDVVPASQVIHYVDTEAKALLNADVIIIATDWPQFRGLADTLVSQKNAGLLVMDGRRMLQHRYTELQKAGVNILAVGSPFLEAVSSKQ